MSRDFIEKVNEMPIREGQLEGIQFDDHKGNITVLDFLINHREDDTNASDESFKFDDTYQKEFDNQLNQEKRFMQTIKPVEPNEVDPGQIIYGTRDRKLAVESPDKIDFQKPEDDSRGLDEDTFQHDVDGNNKPDTDEDAEAETPADVDVPVVDNPIHVDGPNVIEDPDDTFEVESKDDDDSSGVQSNTSYYFDNNESQKATDNESTQSNKTSTPTSLKISLGGPYWEMNMDRIGRRKWN